MARKSYNHIDHYFDTADPDACLCYSYLKKLGRKRSLFVRCLMCMFFLEHANLQIENLTDEQAKALAELYVYNGSPICSAKNSSTQPAAVHREPSTCTDEQLPIDVTNEVKPTTNELSVTKDIDTYQPAENPSATSNTEQEESFNIPEDDVQIDFDLLNGLSLFG